MGFNSGFKGLKLLHQVGDLFELNVKPRCPNINIYVHLLVQINNTWYNYFFSCGAAAVASSHFHVALLLWPPHIFMWRCCCGLLTFEVSRSNTTMHHSRQNTSERVISSSQRCLSKTPNTYKRQINMLAAGLETIYQEASDRRNTS